MIDKSPFFIVGSPRSGTTLLRDILKIDVELECPEETFFYRWNEPFASEFYTRTYFNNATIKKHREIDGVTEKEFSEIYNSSNTRKELQDRYMAYFLEKKGNSELRWFDKTPQNVFGLLLLANDYPQSKFIHIYRHPLNVIASLSMGRMLAKHSIKAAVNTWRESVAMAKTLNQFDSSRMIEIKYETFIQHPFKTVQNIGELINHDFSNLSIPKDMIGHGGNKRYLEAFNDDEIEYILDQCKSEIENLGYKPKP